MTTPATAGKRSRGWGLVVRAVFAVVTGVAALVGAGALNQPDLKGYWLVAAATLTPVLVLGGLLLILLGGAALLVLLTSEHRRQYLGLREWLDAGAREWAGRLDLYERLSPVAVRKHARRLRPSLGMRAFTVSLHDVGAEIGTTVTGPFWPVKVLSSFEDVTYNEGPTRSGKSGRLAKTVALAPGAVVASSTRGDLYRNTAAIRGLGGRPVYLFNPERVGGYANTLRWNPVYGCRNAEVARRRAAYLVQGTKASNGSGLVDDDFWNNNVVKVLRCLLMAADLADRGMDQVAAWVAYRDLDSPARILHNEGGEAARFWVNELTSLGDNPSDKTRGSVFIVMGQSIEWMSDPNVAEVVRPGGYAPFDIERFLDDRGTLYLISEGKQHGSTAPLFTALVGEIHELAKLVGSRQTNERLDPPLTEVLDEAYLTVPVPAPRWSSDAGGSGITMHLGAQGYAQLEERWGQTGARIIWNNATTAVIYPGLKDDQQLERISKLCGEKTERDEKGKAVRTLRLLPIDKLRQLPDWYALVMHRRTPPAIVRLTPIWKDKTCRKLARRAAREELRLDVPPALLDEAADSGEDTGDLMQQAETDSRQAWGRPDRTTGRG